MIAAASSLLTPCSHARGQNTGPDRISIRGGFILCRPCVHSVLHHTQSPLRTIYDLCRPYLVALADFTLY